MEAEIEQKTNVTNDFVTLSGTVDTYAKKKAAEKENVVLTCHGQYFVNLASLEKEKIEASMKRMLDAARRVHECARGATGRDCDER